MKNYLLLFLVTFGMVIAIDAQVESNIQQPISINDTGDLPDSSAILDVNASDRGLLIPRMSTAAKNAIISPAQSLMVFDTTTNQLCHFVDTAWVCLSACHSLDMAYDCGGPGFGRMVTVDAGAVQLVGTDTFSSTLAVSSTSVITGSSFVQAGDGEVATFYQSNIMSGINAVSIANDGLGEGLRILTTNPMNGTSSLDIDQSGIGNGASIITSNMMNGGLTIELSQMGIGGAALITDQNPMDASHALSVFEDGFGVAGYFQTSNPMDSTPTIAAHHFGIDHAGYFETHNPMDSVATVFAINRGEGDGVRGVATTTNTFEKAGVVGSGMGKANVAAALEAHDGAIRVSKTVSPSTPADKLDTLLTSWLPMEDCPSTCGGGGTGGNTHAWNSDVIFVSNVYVDPVRSVIMHSVECALPNLGIKAITKGLAAGGFFVQFVVDTDQCSGFCFPGNLPVTLHYLIINK